MVTLLGFNLVQHSFLQYHDLTFVSMHKSFSPCFPRFFSFPVGKDGETIPELPRGSTTITQLGVIPSDQDFVLDTYSLETF